MENKKNLFKLTADVLNEFKEDEELEKILKDAGLKVVPASFSKLKKALNEAGFEVVKKEE